MNLIKYAGLYKALLTKGHIRIKNRYGNESSYNGRWPRNKDIFDCK